MRSIGAGNDRRRPGQERCVQSIERIVLIGFSGAGKSAVGRRLAERLGWRLIDTDERLEQAFGRSIPQIFAIDGEAEFRRAERRLLNDALATERSVIACGGGAVAEDAVWSPDVLLGPRTLVVALDAAPETSLQRLLAQRERDGTATDRPLLAATDPLARIRSLKACRQSMYDRAHLTLIVDEATPDAIAAEIAALPDVASSDLAPDIELRAPSGSSTIVVRPGVRTSVAALVARRWPNACRAWIVSDDHVAPLHGPDLTASLCRAGFVAELCEAPAGE